MLLTANQIVLVADWCAVRGIIGYRVTAGEVKVACREPGITNDGDFDLYDVKEIGSLVTQAEA